MPETQWGKTHLAQGKDPAPSFSKGGRCGDLEQRTKMITTPVPYTKGQITESTFTTTLMK